MACFQLNHTVGMFQLVRMVRDENDGGAAVLEFVQHPHDVGAPLRVEHGGRLVEHEHIGIHRQHAGDGDALLLAAAHARRIGSAIVAHIHGVQRTGDAQADLIMLNRKILRSERHVVFGDGGDDLVFRDAGTPRLCRNGRFDTRRRARRTRRTPHCLTIRHILIGSHQSGDDT